MAEHVIVVRGVWRQDEQADIAVRCDTCNEVLAAPPGPDDDGATLTFEQIAAVVESHRKAKTDG